MGREWLWWLGEFGLAAAVAVVAGFVTGDVPISILYGLFVGTVFYALRTHTRIASQQERQVSEMEDKALNLPVTLRYQQNIDPYLRRLAQSARDEAIRVAKEAANNDVVLYAPNFTNMVHDFWKSVKPGDKVVATNYGVRAGLPAQEIMRQRYFELIEKGVDITRIFIESPTATPQYKKILREEMDKQKEVHVKVRYIKEERLPPEAKGHNMAVVFDKYLGDTLWHSPSSRDPLTIQDKIRICANHDEVQKAQEMMEDIIKLSEEYR